MQVRCCVLSREIEMLCWAGNDKFIEAQTVKLKSLFNLNKAFFIRKWSHFVWFMFIPSHCKCFCVFKWKVVVNAENSRSSLVLSRFEEIQEFLHAFHGISKRNESIVWLRAVSINLSVLLTLWSRGVCDARMTIFFQSIFVWLLFYFFIFFRVNARKSNGIHKLLLTIIGKLWDCACCGRSRKKQKSILNIKMCF